MNFPSEKS
ncbi:hypothetical protein VCBJG01_2989, partial [Vibrio cholerae BJG-01]